MLHNFWPCCATTYAVRSKARTLTGFVLDETKLKKAKDEYRRIRQQMGRPGIVDLNNSDTSMTRLTMDLSGVRNSQDNPPRLSQALDPQIRYSLSLPLNVIQEEIIP